MSLLNRTALITGGGRGIGRAIAARLAREGAYVILTGRSLGEIAEAAAATGGAAVQVDLGSRSGVDACIARVRELAPQLDILVNNAGMSEGAALDKVTDDLWDRTLELNVTVPFRLCRAFAPAMARAGWGRIVNIASVAGVSGFPYAAPYCAAKHALVGLTRSVALDFARSGVTVNAICPGWVETQMATEGIDRISQKTGRSEEQARSVLEKMSPQNRLFHPDEVAHLTAALCSEEGRGINGQAIVLDGGQVMH